MPRPITICDISTLAFMDESAAVAALLDYVESLASLEDDIMARASGWTQQIREESIGHGVEAFLSTYGLNTKEGVALMCLAEALLRIPDNDTADALIQETFEGRDWQHYTHETDSWWVNLSSWGLLLTGAVIDFGHDKQASIIKNLVGRMGEPIIREALKKAMRLIGGQFVLGESVEEALAHSHPFIKKGYRFSYDILGEGARSDAQALGFVESYRAGIEKIGKNIAPKTALFDAPGISVKLSALHPRYQLVKRERVMKELLPRLKDIVLRAKQAGISVAIDAEESTRLDIEMILFEALLYDPDFADWNGIGFVAQAYQKRAFYLIDWLAELARKYQRVIPIRLVKGAYWDSEIKWAQMAGLPTYPVFTRKEHTDVSYLACAAKILSYREAFYPQFATHNARTIASIVSVAKQQGWAKNSFEFQRLHGMGEALHDLIIEDYPSRIYAPVGPHKDLLAYLIRRLLENGANTSFVHLLMDRSKSYAEILADPVKAAKQQKPTLPLPAHIYGSRENSAGRDFGNLAMLEELTQNIARFPLPPAPADTPISALPQMIARARKAQESWQSLNADARAAMLEKAADLIELHRDELMALCALEAKRTLTDGIAEMREAADFCRYYAEQARKLFSLHMLAGPVGESNQLSLHPRGVFACISPWNFPLAIFVGQVAAALVTGNAVIAKPAEQTPRMAARAVALLHQAGIPADLLQLAFGAGETVGAELVAHKDIAGVVFTGGVEAAQHINKQLAQRGAPIVPLIAETGGQNCMIVDSSALLEHAVDDIILSAFGSVGQRCSALRVLYVQEEIADALLALLAGALKEIALGDPALPQTDMGPVIDAEAQANLLAHIERMKQSAKLVAAGNAPAMGGHFIAPHIFEIGSIGELEREVFGPVLHVIRYKGEQLKAVCEAINGTGFGLTFGMHSRIEEHVKFTISLIKAGNVYINRSMIGATVGVQPFGGEGLSGTGPKAGGPHYLLRFVTERSVSLNTAAVGGNIALITQDIKIP